MGHLNLSASKRNISRQWNLLDLVSAIFFLLVFTFFVLVFTPLGDSLAASGRRSLILSGAESQQRQRLMALIELGQPQLSLEPCAADMGDYVPCEDPQRRKRISKKLNLNLERHCPIPGEIPLCLIPPPDRYRIPVPWPESMNKIWQVNMPREKSSETDHADWTKEGSYLVFSEDNHMFPSGIAHYIQKLGQHIPISGGILRTALDMGCGVASFGGRLLKEDILTLSFGPRDSYSSKTQFALERGIPAMVAVLGTHRLPFPAYSFDLVHCSQCLFSFSAYNGTYFIEVDRLLRPGGYMVVSSPPVQWDKQDKEVADLQSVARALCYELIAVDDDTVIWKKPSSDSCLPNQNEFGIDICSNSDDPSYGWYFKLQNCVSKSPSFNRKNIIGSISKWPQRLTKPPSRLALLRNGIEIFAADTRRWVRRVAYYNNSLNLKIGSPSTRNVMDMNSFFGGFAAALVSEPVWVMNVVPIHRPSTLGVIYDRGLIGVYHDWCEAFSTYPRTYDLIHVSGIDSLIRVPGSVRTRCDMLDLLVEMDRILRPEGTVIIRDSPEVIEKVERIATAIHWRVSIHQTEPESLTRERILVATKKLWTLSHLPPLPAY